MIRAVLFDAVGTLIRPRPSVGAVYARAAARRGARCPARALEAAFHAAYRELLPGRFCGRSGLQTSEPRERRWWRLVAARSFELAACGDTPRSVFNAAFEDFGRGAAWRPMPGAAETLRALEARAVRIGVVSNFDSRVRRVLLELGMTRHLSAIAVSSEVGWAKPHPRIYRAALGALGVEPREALMVGDRLREDVEGARTAGLAAALYDPERIRPGRGAIRRLRAVPRLLGR